MKGYHGTSKRWLEGLYGGSYRPQENGIEIRSQFFKRYLERDNLRIPHVGFYYHQNKRIARPLLIGTDLLAGTIDQNGQQVVGQSDGLYYTNHPEPYKMELTLKPIELLLKRAREKELLTFLPADQHENPDYFDINVLTTTILDKDLDKLTRRERQIVTQRYTSWIGKRLPLSIWRDIFMDKNDPDSQGQLIGKEMRNFLPHCTEYIVEYIPEVNQLLEHCRKSIKQQLQCGESVPYSHAFPIAKDGLTVDLPDNERGIGGNKFDALLAAAFTGDYFQGDDHRHQKRAIIFGACSEYSVRLAIEHLFDADIQIVWLMTCSKGFDLFSSKLFEAHFLMERYGKKLFCTYDWIESLLGPKPAGWDEAKELVMEYDRAQHEQWFKSYKKQLSKGVTSMGDTIILNEEQVLKAAKI